MDEPDNLRLNPQPSSSSLAAYTMERRVWKISMDSREKLLKYPYADTVRCPGSVARMNGHVH